MKGSAAFLKALRFAQGKDLTITTPAACIAQYGQWASTLSPHNFNPLIPIHGGISFVGNEGNGLDALLIGNDWVNLCRKAGADVKNAVLCLAMNYDTHPGMVACALEIAMIAGKKGTDPKVFLSLEDFVDVVLQVYGNDYASIYKLMHETWNIQFKPDAKLPAALKTRSVWRKELGYDVFIHPVNLEPCQSADGTPLQYHGTVLSGPTDDGPRFSFTDKERNFVLQDFPPVRLVN